MRNFLFQVGLAYLRLGRFALALELFDRAWKEEVRLLEQRDTKTDGPTDLGQPSPVVSVDGQIEDASLHYHRYAISYVRFRSPF